MSSRAIQLLRWLRECINNKDPFNRGYVFGSLNAVICDLPAWERQYLTVVSSRIAVGRSV